MGLMLVLCLLLLPLYNLCMLVIVPWKVRRIRRHGGSPWRYLTTGRLWWLLITDVIGAPVWPLFVTLLSVSGVSGGGSNMSGWDALVPLGWCVTAVLVVAAFITLLMLLTRPKQNQEPTS